MREAHADYVHLTEDSVWTLIAAAAEERLAPALVGPAEQLLTRNILDHFYVSPGKKALLLETLNNDGLKEGEHLHLLDSATTMYKGLGGQGVFVQDEQNNVEEILRHSETISALRDRPEAESFLVVLDQGKAGQIKNTAEAGQFLLLPGKAQGAARIPAKSERHSDRTGSTLTAVTGDSKPLAG